MGNPIYNISGQGLFGGLATFVNETATGTKGNASVREGALASALVPIAGTKEIDIIRNYRWTLSNKSDEDQWREIPYIRLREYKCVDSSIKRQLAFNLQLGVDTAVNVSPGAATARKYLAPRNSIDVYAEIWPKDNPTGFSYKFPYFTKKGMELGTEPWTALDAIGESLKGGVEGLEKMVGEESRVGNWAKTAGKVMDLMQAGTDAVMNFRYPAVGVSDRPKVFMAHSNRSIEISFYLYNTVKENDWRENRDLLYLFMHQNLFNKRDLTTGVPPVFYDVYIPGQYYSYASCVTNYQVNYIGNQRLIYGGYIVPDAYEITITLGELVQPSKNQFEALQDGSAENYVKITSRDESIEQNSQLLSQIKK